MCALDETRDATTRFLLYARQEKMTHGDTITQRRTLGRKHSKDLRRSALDGFEAQGDLRF